MRLESLPKPLTRRAPPCRDCTVAATTTVTVHSFDDFGARGFRSFPQETGGRHDHSRSAIGTLHCIRLDEGDLQRMQISVAFEAFDGSDLLAGGASYLRDARAHWLSIEQDCAGAALSLAATVLTAGEMEIVPQY